MDLTGLVAPGVHDAHIDELRALVPAGCTRARVVDVVAAVIERLSAAFPGAEFVIGGPVIQPDFAGPVPFARLVVVVPDYWTFDRGLLDDSIPSLLTLANALFELPFGGDRLIDPLVPVGGLVNTEVTEPAGRATAEYWAGALVDDSGTSLPDGQSSGVIRVVI